MLPNESAPQEYAVPPIVWATGGPPATPVNMAFDIDSIADLQQAELQLKGIDGKPIPLWITLLGPEHSKRKAYILERQRKMREAVMNAIGSTSSKSATGDVADETDDEDNLIAECAVSWRSEEGDFWKKGGQPFACSKKTVLQVLRDPQRQWLRKSIVEAFNRSEAFIKVFDAQ